MVPSQPVRLLSIPKSQKMGFLRNKTVNPVQAKTIRTMITWVILANPQRACKRVSQEVFCDIIAGKFQHLFFSGQKYIFSAKKRLKTQNQLYLPFRPQ